MGGAGSSQLRASRIWIGCSPHDRHGGGIRSAAEGSVFVQRAMLGNTQSIKPSSDAGTRKGGPCRQTLPSSHYCYLIVSLESTHGGVGTVAATYVWALPSEEGSWGQGTQ